jgi:hypothetical protein
MVYSGYDFAISFEVVKPGRPRMVLRLTELLLDWLPVVVSVNFYAKITIPAFCRAVTFCISNGGPNDLPVSSKVVKSRNFDSNPVTWNYCLQGLQPV